MTRLKSAEEAFKSIESNFMTPVALAYFEAGIFAIKLSQGTGIHGETVFGVAVLKRDGSAPRDSETLALSKLLNTIKEAEKYIRSIKRHATLVEIRRISRK